MVIDAHAHFEPRMLRLDETLAKMNAAGVDRIALIPTMSDPLPHTPKRLLSAIRFLMQRDWGRSLAERIHRLTLTNEGNLRLSGTEYKIHAQPDNASVAEVLKAHPDRFLGWMRWIDRMKLSEAQKDRILSGNFGELVRL